MKNFKVNETAQFWQLMNSENCPMTNVNGTPMPYPIWNLIISIRDCKMYARGMKPTRSWKITDVKNYFGITGSAEKCAEQLEAIKDYFYSEAI